MQLLVHPLYYSYHTDFCSCTDKRNRVAFLARPPAAWLNSSAYGGPAPPDANVIPVCIPLPDPDLLKLWIVFPSAMALLLLIISMQCVSVVASWHKHRESSRRRKSEHSPGWLVRDKSQLHVRDRSDPLRCGPTSPAASAPLQRPAINIPLVHARRQSGLGPRIRTDRGVRCRSEVTLVCTDVEGSTAMWEWNSEVMQVRPITLTVIARHVGDAHPTGREHRRIRRRGATTRAAATLPGNLCGLCCRPACLVTRAPCTTTFDTVRARLICITLVSA